MANPRVAREPEGERATKLAVRPSNKSYPLTFFFFFSFFPPIFFSIRENVRSLDEKRKIVLVVLTK